jgi:DNA-binding beta-propeller fold protein YncE
MKDLLHTRAWEVKESPIDLGYRVVPEWGKLPEGWSLGQVSGVATDSKNRVYVFHRGSDAPPLICLDSDGSFLSSYEKLSFGRPHMVVCDADDNVWLADDGSHIIYKLSPDGEVLFTMGIKDVPGEDGIHFNQPTDIAFGPQGEMYVSDGYGNRRIAKFDAKGEFLLDWGSEGEEPGQFALPHGLITDNKGQVYVADRENWRVQIFDPDGKFITQWAHVGRIFDLVQGSDGLFYTCDGTTGRVTQIDASGEVLGFFGESGEGLGQLSTAHDIDYSPNGDIVVGHLDGRVHKFSQR